MLCTEYGPNGWMDGWILLADIFLLISIIKLMEGVRVKKVINTR